MWQRIEAFGSLWIIPWSIEKWMENERNASPVHLCTRMDWSWWPWVAIMTSASSRTNTRIFFKSNTLNLVDQSRTVPGVPMTMWGSISWPLVTAVTQDYKDLNRNYELTHLSFHPSRHTPFAKMSCTLTSVLQRVQFGGQAHKLAPDTSTTHDGRVIISISVTDMLCVKYLRVV